MPPQGRPTRIGWPTPVAIRGLVSGSSSSLLSRSKSRSLPQLAGDHRPDKQARVVSGRHPFQQATLTEAPQPVDPRRWLLQRTPTTITGSAELWLSRLDTSGGRQLDPQLLADGRLDLCHRAGGVDRHDDFLGAEQIQDRPGLSW
jgi:hypothetical protein